MKKIIAFGFALLSISVANAADLVIVNNTDFDSTSVINNGICSSLLSGGVTKKHSTNVVSSRIINGACLLHKTNCKADVYMTDNCTGAKVASVIFDTKLGIKNITMLSNDFTISGSGFQIRIDAN